MKKKQNVTIRLTAEEQVLLKTLADMYGLSQGALVGQLLRREAQKHKLTKNRVPATILPP